MSKSGIVPAQGSEPAGRHPFHIGVEDEVQQLGLFIDSAELRSCCEQIVINCYGSSHASKVCIKSIIISSAFLNIFNSAAKLKPFEACRVFHHGVNGVAMKKKPVVLIIRDGWGVNPGGKETAIKDGNATLLAKTPFHEVMFAKYPKGFLSASGLDVGLPPGQMGNSEVGHLNLGAGRIVYQDLTRINKAIEEGTLAKNPVFVEALKRPSPAACISSASSPTAACTATRTSSSPW